jgi:signal peptidase II
MKNKATIYFIIAIILVIFDQATKLYFKGFNFAGFEHSGLGYGEVIPVIGTILQWTYIENFGMAFGITFGWGKIFLSLFSLVASGAIAYYIYRASKQIHFLAGLALTLILSGAFGNAIDRCFYGVIFGTAPLFYGGVVDFILVDIPDIHIDFLNIHYDYFPVFNIADSCVTVGVILLLFCHNKLPELSDVFPKLKKCSE